MQNCVILFAFLCLLSKLSYSEARNDVTNRRNVLARIVGGTTIEYTKAPYIVSLQYKVDNKLVHHCGAVLLRMDLVLTAAVCQYKDITLPVTEDVVPLEEFFVLGATDDTSKNMSKSEMIPVVNKTVNPNFKLPNMNHNFMFLHLDSNYTLASSLSVIKPHQTTPPKDTNCTIVGYGQENDVDNKHVLRTVTMKVYDYDECKTIYKNNYNIDLTTNMTCVSNDLAGVCSGDVGGPLIFEDKLIGINWGNIFGKCYMRNLPAIYMKIEPYYDWIKSVSGAPYFGVSIITIIISTLVTLYN